VTEAAETAAGRTALVVAAAPVGITNYDADGDRRRRRCPRGAATDVDVMMTMAGEGGGRGDGEATVRRRRGDGEASTRQPRGNKDAKAIGYGAAGGRGNEALNKRITNNRQILLIRP
jgi:hypothetical protein